MPIKGYAMKITSAEFIRSAVSRGEWPPEDLPEIAFLGRSNVGKSSLINSLVGRRNLARTSNTPGRTQAINFFRINNHFIFADLPGYGYAKVAKSVRQSWSKLAEEYLVGRQTLALCIQLVDARHPPSKLDIQLDEWLEANSRPRIVVATKADKLSANQLFKNLREIRNSLSADRIISYSSQTGEGKDDLWAIISATVLNGKNC